MTQFHTFDLAAFCAGLRIASYLVLGGLALPLIVRYLRRLRAGARRISARYRREVFHHALHLVIAASYAAPLLVAAIAEWLL